MPGLTEDMFDNESADTCSSDMQLAAPVSRIRTSRKSVSPAWSRWQKCRDYYATISTPANKAPTRQRSTAVSDESSLTACRQ